MRLLAVMDPCIWMDRYGTEKFSEMLNISKNKILGKEYKEIYIEYAKLQNRLLTLLESPAVPDYGKMVLSDTLNRMSGLRYYENKDKIYIKILTLNKLRGRHVLKRQIDGHYEVTPVHSLNTDLYFILREINPRKKIEYWNLNYIQFTVEELTEICLLPGVERKITDLATKMFGSEYKDLDKDNLTAAFKELHNRLISKSMNKKDLIVYRLPGQDDPRRGHDSYENINLYVEEEKCIDLPAK